MHWLIIACGALLCTMTLPVMLRELLAERRKAAADRQWSTALTRVGQVGKPAIGGFLMIAIGIFMLDPLTGFRVLAVPVGTVMLGALLVHLFASWQAVRHPAGGEAWQEVTERSRHVIKSSCTVLVIACAFCALVVLGLEVDDLANRLHAVESMQPQSGK